MAGRVVRWAVRILLLLAALLLAIGGPVPSVLARVVPGLSPLVAAASAVAQRRWYLGLFWAGPPVALLAMGFWKGRWFCRWICPAGTIYSIPARWSLNKSLLKLPLNAYLFWTIVFASLVGAPLLLLLDPLSTFSRLTPLVNGTYTAASLVPGLLLPLFLVLGAFQPMIWCARVCPLGYLFGLSQSIRRQGPTKTFRRSRRHILAGLFIGVPVAAVTRRFLLAKDSYSRLPVLPPGAADLETFAAACTRCYACVDVCPANVIRVGFDLDRALGQLFQPEVVYFDSPDDPERGFCPEYCNECTRVCAAGALSALTLEQKSQRQIGVAEVIRSACLAWEDGEACAVCQEVCSYGAIDLDESEGPVPRPIVNEDICRGCGACYSHCPAIRAGKAIIVRGVVEQRQLPDGEEATTAPASRTAAAGPQTRST